MGMGFISDYVKRSDATVLKWIRELEFPAVKIGGIWESTTEAIDEWKTKLVNGKVALSDDKGRRNRKGK